MKFVLSFTTSPTRIHKIEKLLESLTNQTHSPDLIVLNIPKIFSRTNESYQIPEFVSNKVFINVVEKDLGPATKVVPTISLLKKRGFNPQDTRIIYFDDDILYPKTLVEAYNTTINKNDNSVYTGSGFKFLNIKMKSVRNHNSKATIAEGYGSVCVRLDAFKNDFYDYFGLLLKNRDCYLSDDIILGNYFAKQNIDIKIINLPGVFCVRELWINGCILEYGNQPDALHLGANNTSDNNVNRYKKV